LGGRGIGEPYRDWGLGTGDWGLGTRDSGLGLEAKLEAGS
jgi:hypothetical protein